MTNPTRTPAEAVETIRRVEDSMIEQMSDAEYVEYMAIPEETRKQMLFAAYSMTESAKH